MYIACLAPPDMFFMYMYTMYIAQTGMYMYVPIHASLGCVHVTTCTLYIVYMYEIPTMLYIPL